MVNGWLAAPPVCQATPKPLPVAFWMKYAETKLPPLVNVIFPSKTSTWLELVGVIDTDMTDVPLDVVGWVVMAAMLDVTVWAAVLLALTCWTAKLVLDKVGWVVNVLCVLTLLVDEEPL